MAGGPKSLSKSHIKARVVDLTEIPWFIVCSKGENFEGESWTCQCEILQANLLGGGPPDESPPPPNGPNGLQPFFFEFLALDSPLDQMVHLITMILHKPSRIHKHGGLGALAQSRTS